MRLRRENLRIQTETCKESCHMAVTSSGDLVYSADDNDRTV